LIDLKSLPKEVQDRLLMKENADSTFNNCMSEDYTEQLFSTIDERRQKNSKHSYIATMQGLQGSGKCVDEKELIYFKRKGIGWVIDKIGNLKVGDKVWSSGYKNMPSFSKVLNVWKSKKKGYIIKTKRSSDFICSEDHKHIIKRNNDIMEVMTKDLCSGDIFLNYRWYPTATIDFDKDSDSYSLGFVTGVYLADGCISYENLGKPFLIITKAEGDIKEKIQYYFNKVFGIRLNEYSTKGKSALTLNSSYSLMVKYFEAFGQKNNKFFVPYQFNFTFLKGLIDGYVNCDSSINVNTYENKNKVEITLMTNSLRLAHALKTTIAMFGFCVSYKERILKSGNWKGNHYHKLVFGRDEGQRFLEYLNLYGVKKESFEQVRCVVNIKTNSDKIKVFNNLFENVLIEVIEARSDFDMIDIETEHGNFFLANGILTHNSFSAIALAGILDDKFSVDKIFFEIDQLVNARKFLKTGDCVLVDEMATAFGIDSNRINIMIQTMKEQLRKRSISMFYCSPTLKGNEYQSSMYVFETLFIQKETKLAFHAYKTNELHTLGYVTIPHPLNFVSKKLLVDYEKKKDEHLNRVLEGTGDSVEERAQQTVKDPLFIKANKLYCEARGYIPYKILVQLVEKIYPEFKGSVIVYEIADRIKTNQEISSVWKISGGANKAE
jgi:intein/homing endonuclease